ncbi:MAG: hypothetical protein Greene07144_1101 [Parcubacteria group bacterium Greene0714_4]|nr:MAG: hypothetical protein Greene07144_1101 [Parcubacteria group bacterium Greene0714_4]
MQEKPKEEVSEKVSGTFFPDRFHWNDTKRSWYS